MTELLPICIARLGVPPARFRVCTSEKCAVTLTVSPALRALFCKPTALVSCTVMSVAGEVLITKPVRVLPLPKFPARSVYKLSLTVRLAFAPVTPCVG